MRAREGGIAWPHTRVGPFPRLIDEIALICGAGGETSYAIPQLIISIQSKGAAQQTTPALPAPALRSSSLSYSPGDKDRTRIRV